MPILRRVYIAGPISKGCLVDNVNRATRAFIELAKSGFAPFCPHWSVYSNLADRHGENDCIAIGTAFGNTEMTHDEWLGVDLPWVECADAVLRLPGESSGADREVALANRKRIPVFNAVQDLIDWSYGYVKCNHISP